MGKWSYQGVLIYPSGQDPWSEDVILNHYIDWRADLCISLKEPWVFQQIPNLAINFVPFAIIDHDPVSPSITSRLRTAFKVIAVSRFGQRQLKQADIPSTFIPHGCDTDVYKPLDKAKCKKMWFTEPDEFVVGIVAMNRSRKQIPRMMRGYRKFLDDNPDLKSHLTLWSNIQPVKSEKYEDAIGLGVADVGVNLLPEIMQLGLGEAVKWPDAKLIREGIPEWTNENGWNMVTLYNSFDVLLLCSGGEGFALPLIEAQSVGCPVVTTDYAAGPEQVGAGLTVPCSDYAIINTPGTRYGLADVDKMAEALTKIMNADPEKLAKKARAFAERYDWRRVIGAYWQPFLMECEDELYPRITAEGVSSWA